MHDYQKMILVSSKQTAISTNAVVVCEKGETDKTKFGMYIITSYSKHFSGKVSGFSDVDECEVVKCYDEQGF